MSLSLWQAASKGSPLQRVEAPLPEPGPEEALLEVLHCGLCHSDISMLDNAWGASGYPLVPGHEVVGRVVAVGDGVNPDLIGQLRGLGWISGSCRHCRWCLGGEANLCADLEATVVGRRGGLASHVLGHQDWLVPIPAGLNPADAGHGHRISTLVERGIQAYRSVIGVGYAIALAADAIAGGAAAVVAKHRIHGFPNALLKLLVCGHASRGLHPGGCWQQFTHIHWHLSS